MRYAILAALAAICLAGCSSSPAQTDGVEFPHHERWWK